MSSPPALPQQDAFCENASYVVAGNIDTVNRTPGNVLFTTVYFSVGVTIDLLCVVLFLLFKRRFERTRLRPTLLVWMAVCGSLAQMLYGCLLTIMRGEYPCWAGVVLLTLVIPLVGGSIIGRLVLFLYLSRFSEGAIRQMALDNSLSAHPEVPPSGVFKVLRLAFRSLFLKPKNNQTPIELQMELYDFRFLISRRGMFLITFIFVLPFLVMALALMASDPVYLRCKNCSISTPMVMTCVIFGLVVILVGSIAWWRIRKLKDAWGLATEAFWCLVWTGVSFIGFLLTSFEGRDVYQTYSHQIIMSVGLWLVAIQQSLVQLALGWWYEYKERKAAQQPARASKTVDMNSGTLDDIMQHPETAQEFERHLAEEFGLESLLFIRDVAMWRSSFYDISESARRARAKHIERTYIDVNGLFSINVPDEVSRNIHAVLRDPNSTIEQVLFDPAIEEVKKLLNTGAVRRFLFKTFRPDHSRHGDSDNNKNNQKQSSQVADRNNRSKGSDLQMSASAGSDTV